MVTESDLLRWIPLLPILGTVVGIIAARANQPKLARVVSPGVVLIAFVLSIVAVSRLWALPAGGALVDTVFNWIHVPPLTLDFALRLDALTSVMLLVITGVGFLIHLYSVGYMEDDPDVARFFAYLNLFMAAMLILVLADSLPVLFIGWEGVGLCSYLLIGFWYADMPNADAGEKAMIVNRIGDAAFLIGIFLIFWSLADLGEPSLRIVDINRQAAALAEAKPWVPTVACLLLLIGATGKSAQLPLYTWLPDAMAGPTPVSAFIHAATMVTAGVYMIARLSPLYVEAPLAMDAVAVVGATTCLFAATIALVQDDLKKILAYSTVSQIGYMVLGVGVGAFSAGIFHLMTHAFFKALLFLCAGSVMHALHGEIRISRMGGLGAKMPITSKTFLVGAAAIAGVPLFSAFFSKDMILEAAFVSGHQWLWLMGIAGAGCTAFYIFRGYFRTFTGKTRLDAERIAHVHEMPAVMTIPLVILAVLAFVGGWVGLPAGWLWGDRFGAYLAPVLATPHGGHHGHHSGSTALLLMVLTTAVALSGILWAWMLYASRPEMLESVYARARRVYTVLWNKYWVDEIYDALVVQPYKASSRFFWKAIDAGIIDGIVNGVGGTITVASDVFRKLQSGDVHHYAFGMVVGAVILVGLYWMGG